MRTTLFGPFFNCMGGVKGLVWKSWSFSVDDFFPANVENPTSQRRDVGHPRVAG